MKWDVSLETREVLTVAGFVTGYRCELRDAQFVWTYPPGAGYSQLWCPDFKGSLDARNQALKVVEWLYDNIPDPESYTDRNYLKNRVYRAVKARDIKELQFMVLELKGLRQI